MSFGILRDYLLEVGKWTILCCPFHILYSILGGGVGFLCYYYKFNVGDSKNVAVVLSIG